MHLDSLGALHRHRHLPDRLQSAPIGLSLFDGARARFVVREHEFNDAPLAIDAAIRAFSSTARTDADTCAAAVFDFYATCMRQTGQPKTLVTTSDAWASLRPTEVQVVIERSIVHLLVNAECEWDEEHGVQLVFRDGRELVYVSDQSGQLGPPDGIDPFTGKVHR